MTFDLDVILAAHGAGNRSPTNELVNQWARELQLAAVGARVTAAFHRGDPSYSEALLNADRPNRLVVPLLTSDGYYAAHLRREAGRVVRAGNAPIVLAPVGTHQVFVQALADRVMSFVAQRDCGPADTGVIVIGHGTARHANSGAATRAVADAIALRSGLSVHVAYLDQAPTIEDVIGVIPSGTHLVILPFLLGGGDHANADIPARVTAHMAPRDVRRNRITFFPPMGGLPVLESLLERVVRETRGDRLLLNVGARASLLSRRQVEIVGARFAPLGVDIRLVPIETRGDRNQSTPIHAFGTDDPFTGDINDALRAGQIDCAVHSMKDLSLAADPAIVDVAILPRGSADEVLVSRAGTRLSALPSGARIGASCARRAGQLRRVRPDVVPVPIRGAVPARIDAVDRGDVDAVVLAAAGLERLDLHGRIAERFNMEQLVPAAAQGAIVVQCRADSPYLELLQHIDHRETRLAVRTELAFARAVAERDARAAAAYATADGDAIELRARIIDPAGGQVWDTWVCGCDPDEVGIAAAKRLLAQHAHQASPGQRA